jgi:hypothetical protein
MSFIRLQNFRRDGNGAIVRGTASIIDAVYVRNEKYHSSQRTKECLGKVLFYDEENRRGIFQSPTRGLVEYDSRTDSFMPVDKCDGRIPQSGVHQETEIHTVFGDSYLLLKFLENSGLMAILKSAFPKKEDLERLLCHVLHGLMRDGSRISCDNAIAKSFASYILDDVPASSLRSDSPFFSLLGDDNTKMAFFTSYIDAMKKADPGFGSGCYVDSTPLPNAIENNPFNALCCHGVSSSEIQTRLVLVLDRRTGLPVWYDIIPGNILDISTLMNTVNDVADSLGIHIESFVLDAGYVSKELVGAIHVGSEKTFIGRMPAKKGFPFKELYWESKPLIGKGKYAFVRNSRTYFGQRKRISLFGNDIFAYVYVDQCNALHGLRNYLVESEDDFNALKDKDKDWATVKYGFFILLSNIEDTPARLLSSYFERVEIETVFKTSKEYLDLLPLSKWSDRTVRGKILSDIIDTIVLLELRKKIDGTSISISELMGVTQSLMCFRSSSGMVTVETANKKTREYYQLFRSAVPDHKKPKFDIEVPSHITIQSFKEELLGKM